MIPKPNSHSANFIKWRFYFVLIFILFIIFALIIRLLDLTVFKRGFLQNQGNVRTLRVVKTPAFRGMITDREGYPLAISAAVYSIWINPRDFSPQSKQTDKLCELLDLNKNAFETKLTFYKKKKREFLYVKRDVSPELAQQVQALNITGLYQQRDYKRYYPEGETTAHIVGFTNIDDQGQEGMELLYNGWLSGSPGRSIVLKDRLGRIISEVDRLQEQEPGHDLALSINHRLQYLAYRELMEGVKKNQAESGSAVVLDVKRGEILAMVNYPSFNPNKRQIGDVASIRNRALTDVFEPGSTIKAFSVATALSSGQFKPETIINTYPGWINVGHHLVRDEHSKGPMSVTQILQISSNVGVTKMILTLPPEHLWKFLHVLGFGEETGIGFPGERTGILAKRDKWSPFALATLAFGYGLSVTTLQLAQAYSILANDGVKIPLSLIKRENIPQGAPVLDAKLAKQMVFLLESVVSNGTAKSASIPGYHVAGKTGTAKKIGLHGYEKRYTSSFVGIAPATQPRLVVAVVLHDPRGKLYYGGDISAPIFKNIMEGGLRLLNVEPDNLQKTN